MHHITIHSNGHPPFLLYFLIFNYTKISRKDDRRIITLTRIISPERRIIIMNDDLSDVIWWVRQMEFDWPFAMNSSWSQWTNTVLWLLMWSSLSYPYMYLFSLVPPFPTYPSCHRTNTWMIYYGDWYDLKKCNV